MVVRTVAFWPFVSDALYTRIPDSTRYSVRGKLASMRSNPTTFRNGELKTISYMFGSGKNVVSRVAESTRNKNDSSDACSFKNWMSSMSCPMKINFTAKHMSFKGDMSQTPYVLAAIVAVAVLVVWSRARPSRAVDLGTLGPLGPLAAWPPDQYAAASAALQRFATSYQSSFTLSGCTKDTVLDMSGAHADALSALYDLRMRLPNDIVAETKVTQQIESVDRALRGYIADAQARAGTPMLFPGPIDDAFYKMWYRAANDTQE